MPLMFGFDVPAFKLLDVLAVEVEYYTNPYFNDNKTKLYAIERNMPATPFIILDQANDPNGHGVVTTTAHHWKWSVFAKKNSVETFR